MFEQAIAGDPGARYFRNYLDYARMLASEGDFTGTKRLLRRAFRESCEIANTARSLRCLRRRGWLEQFDEEVIALGLDANRLAALRRELLAHYEKERAPSGRDRARGGASGDRQRLGLAAAARVVR